MRLSPPISVLTLVAVVFVWMEIPTSISITTSECYGTCPAFKFTASSTGSVIYVGRRYVARSGKLLGKINGAKYREMAITLAPLKPLISKAYTNDKDCPGGLSTDLPDVYIRWWKGPILVAAFDYNYGCDTPDKPAIEAAIAAAYRVVEIQRFIGTPTERDAHEREWINSENAERK